MNEEEELIEEFDPELDHSFDGTPNEDYTAVVPDPPAPEPEEPEEPEPPPAPEEPVEGLDYSAYFTYRRLQNDEDVDVSYPTIAYIPDPEHGGGLRPEYGITNATLRARMYDVTVIEFSDTLGSHIGSADDLSKFEMTVMECMGNNRKAVTFNMGTRIETRNGIESLEPIKEAIFYDPGFVYNEQTGKYELTIYIGAAGYDNYGFNDAEVTVKFLEQIDGAFPAVKYRAILPPFIVQGLPIKGAGEEKVIPDDESRVDYGYDPSTDQYLAEPYKNNAYGYDRDFLFTNSDPLYQIVTSGYMPYIYKPYFEFSGFNASLVNDKTGSKYQLPWEVTRSLEDPASDKVFKIREWEIGGSVNAYMSIQEWTIDLNVDGLNGVSHNTVTCSASVVSKSINN